VQIRPRPFQRPGPPLWIGASVPAAVRRAGLMADAFVGTPSTSLENAVRQVDAYKEAARQAGRPAQVVLMRDAWAARTRAEAEAVYGPEVMAAYRYYWQNRLAEFRSIPAGTEFTLGNLAPDRLVLGDPETCVREFHRWRDATGADYFLLRLRHAHSGGPPHEKIKRYGATLLGSTPYPLGSAEFSALLPKIQAAKPEVLLAVTPGADAVAFLKQAISFGMKKEMRIVTPLHFLFYAKEGGGDLFSDIYGGTSFYWELAETIPQAKRFLDTWQKRFGLPPDAYGAYGFSGIMEVARGVELAKSTDSEAVARALRANPAYDHYKGKQWWRACDNKAFQDMWIIKGRDSTKVRGEWGYFEVVQKVPASEELDRTCAEKGLA
jgi:Periplasmic binding protein/Luciferase-like monooxygenase